MEKRASKGGVLEMSRSVRDAHPAHFMFKIESFSTIVEENIEELESDDFEVADYKWRLCLYRCGNEKANGSGYVSLYLVVKDTDKLPHGWELNVHFKLFIYNHIEDNYLTVEDAGEKPRRFHAMNSQCGFSRLISLDEFNDMSNGYLFEDSCVFGAEIFVIKNSGEGQRVSFIKDPKNKCFTWKIDNFSAITANHLFSDRFTVGEQEWYVVFKIAV